MRFLLLIFAAVLVLLGAGIVVDARAQLPPNTNNGSGSVPALPPSSPTPAPTRDVAPALTATPTPAPRAAPAPGASATTAPKPKPKRGSAQGLPATVKRLSGCLPEISRREGRVLVLRSGLGRANVTSRTRIARALDFTQPMVVLAERRGLRALSRARDCRQKNDSEGVVRDAVAALRAGESKRTTSSSRGPQLEAPAAPAAAAGRGTTRFLFVSLVALLGLGLFVRALVKAPPD